MDFCRNLLAHGAISAADIGAHLSDDLGEGFLDGPLLFVQEGDGAVGSVRFQHRCAIGTVERQFACLLVEGGVRQGIVEPPAGGSRLRGDLIDLKKVSKEEITNVG